MMESFQSDGEAFIVLQENEVWHPMSVVTDETKIPDKITTSINGFNEAQLQPLI